MTDSHSPRLSATLKISPQKEARPQEPELIPLYRERFYNSQGTGTVNQTGITLRLHLQNYNEGPTTIPKYYKGSIEVTNTQLTILGVPTGCHAAPDSLYTTDTLNGPISGTLETHINGSLNYNGKWNHPLGQFTTAGLYKIKFIQIELNLFELTAQPFADSYHYVYHPEQPMPYAHKTDIDFAEELDEHYDPYAHTDYNSQGPPTKFKGSLVQPTLSRDYTLDQARAHVDQLTKELTSESNHEAAKEFKYDQLWTNKYTCFTCRQYLSGTHECGLWYTDENHQINVIGEIKPEILTRIRRNLKMIIMETTLFKSHTMNEREHKHKSHLLSLKISANPWINMINHSYNITDPREIIDNEHTTYPHTRFHDLPEDIQQLFHTIQEFTMSNYERHHSDIDYESDEPEQPILGPGYETHYRAQAPDDEIPEDTGLLAAFNRKLGSFLTRSTDKISDARDFVKGIASKAFGFFIEIFGALGSFTAQYLGKLKKLFVDLICTQIDPSGILNTISANLIFIVPAILALLWSIIAITGIFSAKMLYNIVSKLVPSQYMKDPEIYQAQAPTTNVPGVVIALASMGVGGLCYNDLTKLRNTALTLTTLAVGGTIMTATAYQFLYLLPPLIRDSITYKFGTTAQRTAHEYAVWEGKARSALSLSKIPDVLGAKRYSEIIEELVTGGARLTRELAKSRELYVTHTALMGRLLTIQMTLRSFHRAQCIRDVPFSIHLAGDAGIGKTTMIPSIINELTHYPPEEIFYKSIDKFWSGYIAQKVVVMDEFLIIGERTSQNEVAGDYLSLISSLDFKPDFGSVDNPLVGLKGTSVRPSLVITANNTPYNKVADIDTIALQRRRNVVIHMTRHPEAIMSKTNKECVDITAYPANHNFEWVEFSILPGVHQLDSVESSQIKVSYLDMIEYLKAQSIQHDAFNKMSRERNHTHFTQTLNADEVIDDMLREAHGIPDRPATIFDAISTTIGYSAQGPTYFQENPETNPDGYTVKTSRRRKKQTPRTKLIPANQPLHANPKLDTRPLEQRFPDYNFPKFEKPTVRSLDTDSTFSFPTVDNFDPKPEDIVENHTIEPPPISELDFTGTEEQITEQIANFVVAQRTRQSSDDETSSEHSFMTTHSDEIVLPELRPQRQPTPPLAVQVYATLPHETPENAISRKIELLAEAFDNVKLSMNLYFIHLAQQHEALKCPVDPVTSLGKCVKIAAITTGLFLLIGIIIQIARWIYNYICGNTDSPEPLTFKAQTDRPSKESRKGQPDKAWVRGNFAYESQGTTDADQLTITFEVPTPNNPKQTRTIKGFPITGRTLLTYGHGLMNEGEYIPDGKMLNIAYRGTCTPVTFRTDMLSAFPGSDLVLIEFVEVALAIFPTNIKKFITEAELSQMTQCTAQLGESQRPQLGLTRTVEYMTYAHHGKLIRIDRGWESQMLTTEGDCGLILRAANGKYAGKILGLHVAGKGSKQGECAALATTITREIIEQGLVKPEYQGPDNDIQYQSQGSSTKEPHTVFKTSYASPYRTLLTREIGPNMEQLTQTPRDERVFLNRNTKIRKSVIAQHLPFTTVKEPAVLHPHDPRTDTGDPVVNTVQDTLSTRHEPVDNELVDKCRETVLLEHQQKLFWPIKGSLTFEQACGGIPQYLSSVKTNTSPGLPLVRYSKKQGKKDFIWFGKHGELNWSPLFRTLVEQFIETMENGDEPNHTWLGYLKDETVSPEKIATGRTRSIYCGNLIATVAFRMKFGSLLAAFNNSYENVPSAIGINQYSHDMHLIYTYLTNGLNDPHFQAGDYKSFDKRHHPIFRDAAYNILHDLIKEHVTDNEWEFFVKHETRSPAQIVDITFKTHSNHMSGCFFTTIINNLVNELYHRYCFSLEFPNKIFDQHIRIKVLGDDHILSIDRDLDYPGQIIQKHMTTIGQTYTSDKKDQDIQAYQEWKDITFLGAYPVLIDGKYSGAAKLDTLQKMLIWTSNQDATIDQIHTTAIELCSQHTFETYTTLVSQINEARRLVWMQPIYTSGHRELARSVSQRTAASGATFGYVAQGPPEPTITVRDGADGLTTFQGTTLGVEQPTTATCLAHKGLNERELDLSYGLETSMYRESVDWKTSDANGTILKTYNAPFGMLAAGDQTNIQNMAFDYYIYYHGNMELSTLINGQPFQQGLLCLYWYPLSVNGKFLKRENWTTMPHVWLTPGQSTKQSLTIPYNFPRSVLNTYSGLDALHPGESLGSFNLGVYEKLQAIDATTLSVSFFTSFPGSRITVPRPPGVVARARIQWETAAKSAQRIKDQTKLLTITEEPTLFKAQGQGGSTMTDNRVFNIESIAGDMPVETNTKGNDMENKADIVVPMDNPPLCSGSIPIHQAFSGLSKANGLEPTVNMALHPQRMSRQHKTQFDPAVSDISSLCAKQSLLAEFDWETSDPEGMLLWSTPLSSIMLLQDLDVAPLCLCILNQFVFWRADFVLEFKCVKTPYHSGRLQGTTGYGAPVAPISSNRNTTYNNILDFNDQQGVDKQRNVISIPFNQATEFLRTWEGPAVEDPVQDYSLGWFSLFVNNVLQAPASVVNKVGIKVLISLENVRVSNPRPFHFFTSNDRYQSNQTLTQSAIEAPAEDENTISGVSWFAQGPPDDDVATVTENAPTLDQPTTEAIAITSLETPVKITTPCALEVGEKFEYCVSNLLEVVRRHSLITPVVSEQGFVGGASLAKTIAVEPINPYTGFFAGWGGSLKYRILQDYTPRTDEIAYFPVGVKPSRIGTGILVPETTYLAQLFRSNETVMAIDSVTASGEVGFMKPQEQFYNSGITEFIDVQIPFESHFNYMVHGTGPTEKSVTGSHTGYLVWNGQETATPPSVNASPAPTPTKIYQAVGDDFAFGVFRCPLHLQYVVPDVSAATPGLICLGGFLQWKAPP